MTDKIEVAQEDREAAIKLMSVKSYPTVALYERIAGIRGRKEDDSPIVQAFAAHRIAAEQKAKAHWLEEAAKVVESKMEVWLDKRCVLALGYASAAIRSLGEQE